MNLLRTFVLVLLAASAASAAARPDGPEMTLTDTYDFALRLGALTLKQKAKLGSDTKPLRYRCLTLTSDGKEVRLWLVQIDTAQFSAKGKGKVEVKVVKK